MTRHSRSVSAPLERKAAAQRQAAAGPQTGKGKKKSGSGKFPEPVKGQAKDKVARAVGVDRKTLVKAEAVVAAAEAEPETFEKVRQQMDRTARQLLD